MKKSEKIFFVENLAAHLKDAKSIVLIDPSNLKVNQQQTLRRRLSEAGGKFMVVKNTLLERALRQISDIGYRISDIKPALTGQTAVVVATDDELSPIQVLGKFIRDFELPKFKIGVVGGNLQDSTQLLTLSRLPSREVLYGQAVGTLIGPLYGLVGVLQVKMQELVYILNEKTKVKS